MAQVKVFYEPEMELLTVFWQSPPLISSAQSWGMGSSSLKTPTAANRLAWNCYPTVLDMPDSIPSALKAGRLSRQHSGWAFGLI